MNEEKNNPTRFYSDFYDSVFQRTYWKSVQEDVLARYRFLGKLRLDSILSKTVVLADTQLLDGAFFLDPFNDPYSILKDLSRGKVIEGAIEIRARDYDLEKSLLMFVKDPKGISLKSFSFSSIYDPESRALATDNIIKLPGDQINTWQDILTRFKEFGIDKANVENIEMAWSKWIELQKRGMLKVVEWNRNRGFQIERFAGTKEEFLSGIKSKEVKSEGNWVYSNLLKRSLLDVKFEDLKHQWDAEMISELRILEAKYHRIYDQAAAWQHYCGSYESSVSTLIELLYTHDEEDSQMESVVNDITTNQILKIDGIDPFFLYKLGTMPTSEYEKFFWNHSANLSLWWNHNDIDSLRVAIDGLVTEISNIKETPKRNFAKKNILADIFKVILDTTMAGFDPLSTFLKGMNDIRIEYSSDKLKNPKEILIQRIIDVAKKRIS